MGLGGLGLHEVRSELSFLSLLARGTHRHPRRHLLSSAPRGRLLRKGPGRTRPAVGLGQEKRCYGKQQENKLAGAARLPRGQGFRFGVTPHGIALQMPGLRVQKT